MLIKLYTVKLKVKKNKSESKLDHSRKKRVYKSHYMKQESFVLILKIN